MRLYIFRSKASTGLRAFVETRRAANCRISFAPGNRLEGFGPRALLPMIFPAKRSKRQLIPMVSSSGGLDQRWRKVAKALRASA